MTAFCICPVCGTPVVGGIGHACSRISKIVGTAPSRDPIAELERWLSLQWREHSRGTSLEDAGRASMAARTLDWIRKNGR